VAGYGPALALTVTLAVAAFLIVMPLAVLGNHPQQQGLGAFAAVVNQQNQDAKTALYVAAFLVILPLALFTGPRVADAIARGVNGDALNALTGILVAGLAAAIVVVRASRTLPWGDGLKAVLGAAVLWSLAAGAALARTIRGGPWSALLRVVPAARTIWLAAGALVALTLVCVTSRNSLSVPRLVAGGFLAAGVLVAYDRLRVPRLSRWPGRAIDAVAVVLLVFAIPDLVVFRSSASLPNVYVEPGIIQFQHDYILGSANQLLGGGALLVGVPVSQYGVGLIYFLAAVFHIIPIGYGTFGFIDGVLTAMFYAAAYCVLRMAGVSRVLAGSAVLVGLLALIYNLQYTVGALPEEGPLRFGLPMVIVIATIAAVRWPRRARIAGAVALCGLGVASIWAFETFLYTLFTFIAVLLTEAWLRPTGDRGRWLIRHALLAVGACVLAHMILALATLIGTGHLPDWGQYLAYVHAFLLGGTAGAISYGFSDWSPGLAVGVATLASASAVVLLVRRAPGVARRERAVLLGLSATTAYEIAILSYTDNRSSTYLLPYVALPLLMAGVLWLALLLQARAETSLVARRGGVAFSLALIVLLLTAAWPSIGGHLSRTAIAHAYPGGGLRAAVRRLWHPPPIDPRAPEGERLLRRYIPGKRVLILLPTVPDLGTEILIRTRRANSMFIGDPKADSLVPSVWLPKLQRDVAALRAGDRLLTDRAGLLIAAALRANPAIDPLKHPIAGGFQEEEWLLREIDRRLRLRPVYRDPDGLIVAALVSRAG
jgi:hypothetical protein